MNPPASSLCVQSVGVTFSTRSVGIKTVPGNRYCHRVEKLKKKNVWPEVEQTKEVKDKFSSYFIAIRNVSEVIYIWFFLQQGIFNRDIFKAGVFYTNVYINVFMSRQHVTAAKHPHAITPYDKYLMSVPLTFLEP